MKISITGTPCTGKTSISEKLSKELNYKLISINDLAEKLKAFSGYDKKRKCKIVDMGKIKEETEKLKEDLIFEGHTSHEIPVDIVIVLRCKPPVLKKRLEQRYPDNPSKVQENIEAEILGVIISEALIYNKNIHEIDTSDKTPEKIVEYIVKITENKTENFKVGKIDWLEKYVDIIDKK